MKILVFGMLAEDAGATELDIAVQRDTDSLRAMLLGQFPELKNRQFIIAVNKQKTNGNLTLNPTDEIALIPPYAGG